MSTLHYVSDGIQDQKVFNRNHYDCKDCGCWKVMRLKTESVLELKNHLCETLIHGLFLLRINSILSVYYFLKTKKNTKPTLEI